MNFNPKITFAYLLALTSTYALANEAETEALFTMDLEQLLNVAVDSPSKFSQLAADAPAVISVISRRDIEHFGANSLLEILDRSTSMSMTGSFFFPQNVASLRGDFESHSDNHMMILLNGRPMRESFTGGENFSIYTVFPVDMIKQIEIIRGPGSVLYGSSAFLGVINIVTTNAKETQNRVSATLGSFSTRKIAATSHYQGDDLQLSAGLNYFDEQGWTFNARDNNNQPGAFDTGEDNYSMVLGGTYKDITFNSMLTRAVQDFWGSTSTWSGSVPQSERDIASKRFMVDIGYQYDLSTDNYINTNISYSQANFSHYNYDSQSKNLFAEATHHWQVNDNLRWLFGTTIWHQDVSSEAGELAAPVADFNQNWWSLYGQLSYKFAGGLNWILGAQVNKIPQVSANTVPRMGFIYQLDKTSGVKLMHGQAFRAAYGVETNFDLVLCCNNDGTNKGGLRGNAALKPETITTTDLQYYVGNDNYQFNGTLFYSQQEDLIERQRAQDNIQDFVNRGHLKSKGIELEYKYAFSHKAQLTASYTYQTNEAISATAVNVEDFTLQPNSMFKIGYSNEFDNGITLGLFDSYFSHAHDNAKTNPNRIAVNPTADSYNLVTAKVRIPLSLFSDGFSEKSAIEFYGYNLLDEDVYQSEMVGRVINSNPLRAGRSFYLTFDWVF